MSQLKNDKEQYEKYLSGKMSAEEANAFERGVLNDPFEQEALEGFEANDPAAISDIEKLQAKVLKKEHTGFGWMRIAAVVALLIVGSFTVWLVIKPIAPGQEMAMENQETEEEVSEESLEQDLKPPVESEIEKIDPAEQKETLAESGVEVEEAQSGEPVVAEEELTLEAEPEQVAIAENLANDLQISSDAEAQVEDLEVEGLGEIAVALAPALSEQSQSGAPAAINANDIQLDTTSKMSLSQNLVAEEGGLETLTRAKRIPDAAKPEASEVDLTLNEPTELKEVVVTTYGTMQAKRSIQSDSRTITGKITDDAGESLPGVNVIIKGTTTGVTSDLDGNFQLNIDPGSTLVISFVGFETQEVEVGNRSEVDITIGGVTELQEVVVTGYGTTSQQAPSLTPSRPMAGNRDYKKYLEENLRYPEQATNNEIAGTVVLELTISSTGAISNIDIKKSLGFGCDVEAIRLVNEGPKWSVAERNGSKVEDKVKVKVKFKR